MKVVVLVPRTDLPFKKPLRMTDQIIEGLSQPDTVSLRHYWNKFANSLTEAFSMSGHSVEEVVLPLWEITDGRIAQINADMIFVPHRHRGQFPQLSQSVNYYMQVIFPWLFTADIWGWSAAASHYPCDSYKTFQPDTALFDRYVQRICHDNQSKFMQPPHKSRLSLWLHGQLPLWGKYVFFPCQIPHDESILFFSPFDELEVIEAVVDWAKTHHVHVVFKKHPKNLESMAPLVKAATGSYIHWSEASVHDLIEGCAAVFTINSGVGFEALLHKRPVVTFGHTEYDAVTIPVTLETIDVAWSAVKQWRADREGVEYIRYVSWFCRTCAIDLSDEEGLADRLSILVKQVEQAVNDRICPT